MNPIRVEFKNEGDSDSLGWRDVDVLIPGFGTLILEWNEDTMSVDSFGFEPDIDRLESTIRNHFELRPR